MARYLQRALAPDQKRIRAARFSQSGMLRTSARSRRWMHFTAAQTVTPPAHEFAWDARVRIAPLVQLRVRDRLSAGRGAGRMEWLKIKLAEDAGTPQMNSGALHRYLAEAVWYPTALLPGEGLRWKPTSADKAVATLTSRGTTVSLRRVGAASMAPTVKRRGKATSPNTTCAAACECRGTARSGGTWPSAGNRCGRDA